MNEIMLTRTKPVLPSLLGSFSVCPAKYLLESETQSTRLPVHPRVILGRVIHKLVDSVKHSRVDPTNITLKQLENDFTIMLKADRYTNLVTGWIYDNYGIDGLISRKILIKQIRYIRTLVPPIIRDRLLTFEKNLPLGHEIKLKSNQFDMQGRADLIYQYAPNLLRIVDFKTGDIIDNHNNPKEAYLLQIAAYGIMVQEMMPNTNIELSLEGVSQSWNGPLDKELTQWVTCIIGNLNKLLPKNTSIPIAKLAYPDVYCLNCNCRYLCPMYIKKLHKQMFLSNIEDSYSEVDISGRLLAVEDKDNHLTLKMLFEDGTFAKIFRVPANIYVLKNIIGKKIELYGLKTFQEISAQRIPRNFYVIDIQNIRRSAFHFYYHSQEIG